MKRKFTRLLSLLLVAALLVGLLPMAVLAEEKTHTYTYMSMGDSTSNGYTLSDYVLADCGLGDNASRRSYPYKVYYDLQKEYGDVTFYQYCLAGMRTNELRALLEDDFSKNADGSWKDYDPEGGFDYFCQRHMISFEKAFKNKYGENDISGAFRKAIQEADLITLDLSMNNFGTYVSNRLMYDLGAWERKEPDIYYESIEGIREELDAMFPGAYEVIQERFVRNMAVLGYDVTDYPAHIPDPEDATFRLVYDVMNAMSYCIASYLINFTTCMEHIYALNPDVQVVAVGTFNGLAGLTGILEKTSVSPDEPFAAPFGEVWTLVLTEIDDFLREGLPYAPNKFATHPETYGYTFSPNEKLELFVEEVASCIDEDGHYTNVMSDETTALMVDAIYGELITDNNATEMVTNAFLDGIAAMADEQFAALGIKGAGNAFAENVRKHFGIDGVNKKAFTAEDIKSAYANVPENMGLPKIALQGLTTTFLKCHQKDLANYCVVSAFEQIMAAFAKAAAMKAIDMDSLFGLLADMSTVGDKFAQALTDFDHADEGIRGYFHAYVRFIGVSDFGTHPNAVGCETKYRTVHKAVEKALKKQAAQAAA